MTVDVPLATLNKVERGAVHLARARPAARPGRRADPVAAQAAAGQLRAGPERRPAVPRRGAAGGGAAARRAGALPARRHRRARAPGGLGLRRRCPSTCGRRSGWSTTTARVVGAGQGPRGAQGAAAADVRPRRWPRPPTRPGSTSPARRRGPSAPSSRRSPRPAPATRCAASRRSVDEGTTVGLRVLGSEAEQEASHRLGVRRLLLLRPAVTGRRRSPTGSTTPTSCGWPARRTRTCRTCSTTASPPPSASLVDRRGRSGTRRRSTALATAHGAELPETARRVLHDVLRVLGEWRDVDKALHGSVEMTHAAGAGGHAGPARPAGAPRVRRRRRGRAAAAPARATWPRSGPGVERLAPASARTGC